jgi:hypothetical protein
VSDSNSFSSSVDQNNNGDAPKSSIGPKIPRPLDGGQGPTMSQSFVGHKPTVSASVGTDDGRRSWITGQRATWASFSSEDDEFAMYRISKAENAQRDAENVRVPTGRSKPPSLMTRSLSMVCCGQVPVHVRSSAFLSRRFFRSRHQIALCHVESASDAEKSHSQLVDEVIIKSLFFNSAFDCHMSIYPMTRTAFMTVNISV